jgi:hypothetical protein
MLDLVYPYAPAIHLLHGNSDHGDVHACISTGKSSLTISAKPLGVGAASQRLIPTGERSGLADAHCDDRKRFVVPAEEKLTEPMAIHIFKRGHVAY